MGLEKSFDDTVRELIQLLRTEEGRISAEIEPQLKRLKVLKGKLWRLYCPKGSLKVEARYWKVPYGKLYRRVAIKNMTLDEALSDLGVPYRCSFKNVH